MVRAGDRVAVALLHVLRELAADLDISLAVAHLNHQLRGDESNEDEAFVRGLAGGLGLDCHVHSVDVRAEAGRRGENLSTVGASVDRISASSDDRGPFPT